MIPEIMEEGKSLLLEGKKNHWLCLLEKETATRARTASPGEFHGQRPWAGYSPWGDKESDTTV